MAPAKCAAMPASAMIQENPLSRADDANSLASFGHRWADSTRTSVSISYSFRTWIAFSATGRSLVLPMMTATFRMALASLKQQKWALHCPNVQLKCPDGRLLKIQQKNALCSPVVTHVSVSYKELNLTNLWYHRGPLSSMRQKRETFRPISRFFDDNRHIHKLRLYLLFENVQTWQKKSNGRARIMRGRSCSEVLFSPVERHVDDTQKAGKHRGNIGSGEQIVLCAE